MVPSTLNYLLTILCLPFVSAEVKYPEYILAPTSRTVVPVSVYQTPINVTNPAALTTNHSGITTLTSFSHVTYDFGVNIGGIVSLTASTDPNNNASIWISYSESSLWINPLACDATEDSGFDAPLHITLSPDGKTHTYTASPEHDRGAFRYLTLMTNFTTAPTTLNLTSLSIHFTASPLAPSNSPASAYTGYFHSSSPLLNRIWYAGAYTLQLCTIPPSTGYAVPLFGIVHPDDNVTLPDANPWFNNYTISPGPSVLVDGAKRDRLVWPGDLAHALPGVMYSVDDGVAVKAAMESVWALQRGNGLLPWVGEPVSRLGVESATYHLHGMMGVAAWYGFTGDEEWVRGMWTAYQAAMDWAIQRIDSSGMMDVGSATADWLRGGTEGHALAANALLYRVLLQGADLALYLFDDMDLAMDWTGKAAILQQAVNLRLWDADAGMYRDNEHSDLHPQDGNSLAAMVDLPLDSTQLEQISASLKARWTPFGAPAPEVDSTPATISPFASGFELGAHFATGTEAGVQAGLDLMEQQWGFMLDGPGMTNSTFIEGYATDGTLVYAPYPRNPARISHAHGWSAAPVWVLSSEVAGMKVWGGGNRWVVKPQLGSLESVEAGLKVGMGYLEVRVVMEDVNGKRVLREFEMSAPEGTVGDVILPAGTEGTLWREGEDGHEVELVDGAAMGLVGGAWTFEAKKMPMKNQKVPY